MRPEIPEALAQRIDDIYEDAGYANRGELVRDAVRRRLEEVEGRTAAQSAGPPSFDATFREADGIELGINPATDESVKVDRFARPVGPNALFAGDIGSGKSASVKAQILRELRQRDDLHIVVIDPLEGFVGVNEVFGGQRIVVGGDIGVNPLEIRETPEAVLVRADGLNPYASAVRRALTFFETYLQAETDAAIDDAERGVLERAIHDAYGARGITSNTETHGKESPTVSDVLDVLSDMAQNPAGHARTEAEGEVRHIVDTAAGLLAKLYSLSEGGQDDNLSRPTEIDPFAEGRMTYVDLQQQGGHRTGMMMQLLFNAVYEQAKQVDGDVMIVVDEAHYLVKDAASLEFLEQAVRHSRHYGTSVNLITQTVGEFLVHDAAEVILHNCSLVQLHRIKSLDEAAADALGASEAVADRVRAASPGTAERGHSEAMLAVDGEWIPLHVVLDEDEKTVVDYDPRSDDRDVLESLSV